MIDFIFIFQMLLGIVFLEKLLLNFYCCKSNLQKLEFFNKVFYLFLQIANLFFSIDNLKDFAQMWLWGRILFVL